MNRDISVLLDNIRNGVEMSFEEILTLYQPLIKKSASVILRCFSLPQDRIDDLSQEGSIALYNAAMTYKRNESVSFGLYAKICIKNRLVSYIRSEEKISAKSEYIDDIPGIRDNVSDDGTPEKLIISRESLDALNSKIDASLTEFEKSVFWLYLGGLSYRDMSEALGREPKSIDNAISRIKAKLRKLL